MAPIRRCSHGSPLTPQDSTSKIALTSETVGASFWSPENHPRYSKKHNLLPSTPTRRYNRIETRANDRTDSQSSLLMMTTSKPKGRQRNSSSHSKKGCGTCKTRRVKCGEEKPECLRCKKSGWRCDGYETPLTKSKPLAPLRPQEEGTSISTYKPSIIPDLNEEEQRYFQIYLDQTSTSLELQNTTSLFWMQVVLQESYSNPCVRHGIVAIGAVAKSSFMRLRWAYFTKISDRTQESHRQFALIQYQKAIQGLRAFIDGVQKGKGCRSALICCMVLILFDCFYGNVDFAAQHIHFGRKLLSAWMSCELDELSESRILTQSDAVDCILIQMFAGLDIEATSFLEVEKEYTYPSKLRFCRQQPITPGEMQTLEEAKLVRQDLWADGYNIYLRTLQYQSSPAKEIPEEVFQTRKYYLAQITLLNSCLNELCREQPLQDELHPLSRAAGLRFHTTILFIRLSYTLSSPALLHDDMLEYFIYLLSFSKQVIEFETRASIFPAGVDLESYTFEPRIIPALYLVATKCHRLSLRREAIELLKFSDRREGLWNSCLSAKAAEWIIEIETERLTETERFWDNVSVPENTTVFGETMEVDVQGRRLW